MIRHINKGDWGLSVCNELIGLLKISNMRWNSLFVYLTDKLWKTCKKSQIFNVSLFLFLLLSLSPVLFSLLSDSHSSSIFYCPKLLNNSNKKLLTIIFSKFLVISNLTAGVLANPNESSVISVTSLRNLQKHVYRSRGFSLELQKVM